MSMDPARRFRLESLLLFLVLAGFVGAASVGEWFAGFDRAVYDLLLRAAPPPLHDDLVIVGVDERSLDRLGPWPWDRGTQARLLREVGAAAPRAVLVDVVYAGTTRPEHDAALVAAVANLPVAGLPLIIDALTTGGQLIEVLPFPDLAETADVLGHVQMELDPDALVRGTYLYQGIGEPHWPHLALALAAALGAEVPAPGCPAPGQPTLQNVRCHWAYLPFIGPPGSFPQLSALDVMEGRVAPAALADRIVLVGVTAAAASDRLPSPLSGDRNPMAGIELNANLLNGVLQDALLRPTPRAWVLIVALLLVTGPALLLPRLQPKPMLAVALVGALIPLLLMALAQLVWARHLPLAAAAVAALAAYPYWSWRRHEIAWSFVAAEMSRVSVQRGRWTFGEREAAPEAVLDRLGDMLRARWRWAGPEEAEAAGSGTLRVEGARPVLLQRERPFDPAECRYARRIVGSLAEPDDGAEILPGERLAARIRRLQRAAAEVRAGRDVGLRGLAEMPNGVAVLSAVGEVLFVNEAAQRLLGPGAEPGQSDYRMLLAELVAPLGRGWHDIAAEVVVGGATVSFETQSARGVSVLFEAAPLARPGDPADYWVITVTDMTDIRAAERDREEALAFVSHDLRSPMLSVLALVRDAAYSEVLADIGRYAEKALSASEQFLQLSRVQAREQFETYPLNVVDVLRNASEQMFVLARERGIAVVLEPTLDEDEAGLWVMGNGELLERAFVNLLSNAVKYSDPGSTVRVDLVRRHGRLDIGFVDQGLGIPTAEQARIFEPYFRSASPDLADRRGAGLGLRFVRTVVERHGGEVRLESRPGAGSRFTVILPELETDAPVSE